MTNPYVPQITLHRASSTPLYEQIAVPIEHAILSGELPAGTMLEDEVSMAQRLDVARPTARRALQDLVGKGLLTRRRGVGTRVTPPHVQRPMRLSSLNEDLLEAGYLPHSRLLAYVVRAATQEEAEQLDIAPEAAVVELRRLRCADDSPLAILTNLLPLEFAPPWQELGSSGLYERLSERGIQLASANQHIGARPATPEEASTLEVEAGAPLLTMHRVGRTTSGRIVEIGNHVYRADRYSFGFSLFDS